MRLQRLRNIQMFVWRWAKLAQTSLKFLADFKELYLRYFESKDSQTCHFTNFKVLVPAELFIACTISKFEITSLKAYYENFGNIIVVAEICVMSM